MKLPHHPLTNLELKKYASMLAIPYFRGIYMRNKLPKKIRKRESGIVNLDDALGRGTHWVAYKKQDKHITYFDSYGDLRPPVEIEQYLLSNDRTGIINYNYRRYQKDTDVNCGQLCLEFLTDITDHT